MVEIDDRGRPEAPIAANEIDTLRGFLDYQRATLAWKCRGLDTTQLGTRLHPTTMTLAGLLKHLAWVEEYWFTFRLQAERPAPPFDTVDWKADPDWEWRTALDDTPEELFDAWEASIERSRASVDRALAEGGLDLVCKRPFSEEYAPTLRWIICHMIEEYARHNGHADLLRENIDGETGE